MGDAAVAVYGVVRHDPVQAAGFRVALSADIAVHIHDAVSCSRKRGSLLPGAVRLLRFQHCSCRRVNRDTLHGASLRDGDHLHGVIRPGRAQGHFIHIPFHINAAAGAEGHAAWICGRGRAKRSGLLQCAGRGERHRRRAGMHRAGPAGGDIQPLVGLRAVRIGHNLRRSAGVLELVFVPVDAAGSRRCIRIIAGVVEHGRCAGRRLPKHVFRHSVCVVVMHRAIECGQAGDPEVVRVVPGVQQN